MAKEKATTNSINIKGTVTDSSGATGSFTLDVPLSGAVQPPAALVATATITPASGLATDQRAIVVSGAGGTPPYTYATPVASGVTFTPVAAGKWTFTAPTTVTVGAGVTDSAGVTSTGTAVCTVSAAPPQPGTGDDGSAGAPAGAAQLPTLLAPYPAANRPTWKVAGVDYAVGYPTGTTLKPAATGALPSGVSRDLNNKVFNITADNVVIDGWDLSGWQVYADNASDPTIKNCNFKISATASEPPIRLLGRANGYTGLGAKILNNIIDGAGVNMGGLASVIISRGGAVVVQYNWIKNSGADHIAAGAETVASGIATTYDIRWNVIQEGGAADGGGNDLHPDWMQTYANGHYNNIRLEYNTVVQAKPFASGGGTQGFTLNGNTNNPLATFDNASVKNNTVITTSTPVGAIGFVFNVCPDITTGTFTFSGNRVDPSSFANGGVGYVVRYSTGGGPYHGTITCTDNIDMRNGKSVT